LNSFTDNLAGERRRVMLKPEKIRPYYRKAVQPATPPTCSTSRQRRSQARQNQGIQKKNKVKRWDAASKLKALFKRYPKLATRKVLE
jgi:hypothetical protein